MLIMDQEVVTIVSRTGKLESFTYDGRIYDIDAEKGMKAPRPIAELAVKQNALKWDGGTGLVTESKLFIKEDEGKELVDRPATSPLAPEAMPSSPITQEEIQTIKETDGLGDDTIMIDGKLMKKKRINLKPQRESFAANNQ